MSDLARRNGWRGFDIGERVDGGWLYKCDGLPTLMGCGAEVVVSRRWARVGVKKSGWLVCYGREPKTPDTPFDDPDGWVDDVDVVLTFCPRCADVVRAQDERRKAGA